MRKGIGTIDQVYALNYLINRQLGREKGEMYPLFVEGGIGFRIGEF